MEEEGKGITLVCYNNTSLSYNKISSFLQFIFPTHDNHGTLTIAVDDYTHF